MVEAGIAITRPPGGFRIDFPEISEYSFDGGVQAV
jgi:hypothetical protein